VIETFSFRPIFFVGAPVREMAEGSEEWRQKNILAASFHRPFLSNRSFNDAKNE